MTDNLSAALAWAASAVAEAGVRGVPVASVSVSDSNCVRLMFHLRDPRQGQDLVAALALADVTVDSFTGSRADGPDVVIKGRHGKHFVEVFAKTKPAVLSFGCPCGARLASTDPTEFYGLLAEHQTSCTYSRPEDTHV